MVTMGKGGARSRSGPQKDPNSERSERLGFKLTALPSEGYDGEVPTLAEFLPLATDRHETVWAQLWTTPQACAWSMQSWRWPVVADLVKYMVRSEPSDSPAANGTLVRQLRDDCGLSKAGLTANGWAIAVDEVAAKRDEQAATPEPAVRSSRQKLKVVPGGN
jgi:hypothetical protein